MAGLSGLSTKDIVIPAVVWAIIFLYYIYQSKRYPRKHMEPGKVTSKDLYYPNFFFYVSMRINCSDLFL